MNQQHSPRKSQDDQQSFFSDGLAPVFLASIAPVSDL
jgi:hypothetical protein